MLKKLGPGASSKSQALVHVLQPISHAGEAWPRRMIQTTSYSTISGM